MDKQKLIDYTISQIHTERERAENILNDGLLQKGSLTLEEYRDKTINGGCEHNIDYNCPYIKNSIESITLYLDDKTLNFITTYLDEELSDVLRFGNHGNNPTALFAEALSMHLWDVATELHNNLDDDYYTWNK